ncbi:hypothetical protein Tco_1024302 [Tanacetum coccineum]
MIGLNEGTRSRERLNLMFEASEFRFLKFYKDICMGLLYQMEFCEGYRSLSNLDEMYGLHPVGKQERKRKEVLYVTEQLRDSRGFVAVVNFRTFARTIALLNLSMKMDGVRVQDVHKECNGPQYEIKTRTMCRSLSTGSQ